MAIQTQMNLGRVRPVYKGAYNALAAYGTLDMVLYEKEIWMMVARSYTPGDLPVDAGNGLSASGAWAKIGYQGERGLQGETGPIGPYYRPSVAVDGTFSWTNDGGLVNPDPVKIDLYWHTISGTAARVSTTQFTVAGTESVIVEGRGVRINDAILTHIKSVSVANDVTTVTVDTAVVPATISKVEVGVLNTDMLPTITGFLPLSGGTLTGDITTKNIIMSSGAIRTLLDSQAFYQYGGTGWQHGAQITLFGKDHSTNPGDFTIHADNGTNSCDLFGRPNGTLLWNGNKVVTDNVETITPTFDTAHFKPYNDYSSYKPTLKKMGKVCMVRGVISPLAEIPADGMDFATIPSGYRPPFNVFTLCQGSGANKWLLTITGDTGAMNISRYGVSTWSGDPIPAGVWLPFTLTYICA